MPVRPLAPCAALLLAFASVAGIACGPPAAPPPPPEEPPHLLYSADTTSLDNPFPDARLITADGMRLDLRKDWYRPFLMPKAITAKMGAFLETYTYAASELHGANNFGPMLLRPSAPLDRASLKGAAARLVKNGDHYEVLEADVAVEHSRDALEGTGKEATADYPEFIVVRPSVPLPSGAEGMLVIRKGLRTVDGVELARGQEFDHEDGNTDRVAAAAQALGVDASEILLALPLEAQDVTPVMIQVSEFTNGIITPAYTIPAHATIPDGNLQRIAGVWTTTDSDWASINDMLVRWSFDNPASDVGQVISGTFKAKDFRENGIWCPEWAGDPINAPEEDLWFTLVLPKGPKPPGGYKVVIGGHGLQGRNTVVLGQSGTQSFCLDVAEVLAKKGLGCLGIDAPSHGTRGNPLDFFAIEDLRKARDNFRQMAFDQMQLSKLATVLDVDGDGTPDLSPDIGYFGNSLGGIMGGNFMALDPRVKYGVLNVPGGGLANILAGASIRDQVGLLLVTKSGIAFGSAEYYSAFPMFRTIGQLFMEQGDPVNMAEAFRSKAGRAVLVQEGIGDQTVPNPTTEDLAKAMAVDAPGASVSGTTPLRSITRIDPVKFGKSASFNGHNVFWDIEPARTQVLDFLGSGGTSLTVE